MRICFVSRGSLNSFWDTYGGSDADIVFFGFQGIGEVSYEKELRGETGYFEDAAILSKENHNVVVCGCVTDTRGVKRKSAVVAENGRLLGVSDMLNAIDGEYKSGAGLRVYETKVGRLGIAVAEDLYFPEILRTLAVCGSDLILCPFGDRLRFDGVRSSARGRVFLRRTRGVLRRGIQPACRRFGRRCLRLARQPRGIFPR